MVKQGQRVQRVWVGTLDELNDGALLRAFPDLTDDSRIHIQLETPPVADDPLPLPDEWIEIDGKPFRRGDPAAMLAAMATFEREGQSLSAEEVEARVNELHNDRHGQDEGGC